MLLQGFARLMDERRHDDLQRFYDLFSEADLVYHLNNALSSYIRKNGQRILKEGSSLTKFKASVDQICHFYYF